MAPHRFAVAVVLVCAGVMLLSACGLGLNNSRYVPPPVLAPVYVLLVKTGTSDAPEKNIGSAMVGGTSMQDLSAELTLTQPFCGETHYALRGSAGIVSPPWIRLSGNGSRSRMALDGTLAHLSRTLSPDLFPFPANLRIEGCGASIVQRVEVRRGGAPGRPAY